MERGLSGQYETRTLGGETVRAFVPSPLPPAPPIRIEGELARLHEKALLACGRLDAVTTLLPEPDLFIYAYVRREALLSSQIEGTQSSISDLLRFEAEGAPGAPFNEVAEVSNYVSAMEHGLTRIRDGFPLSNRLLREMHGRLLARGRGANLQPGEFRTTQNWIGGTRPGNAAFVPAPPDMLQDGMAALEQFLHDPNLPFSALVRAALAHVQIETLHPFLDGNGRMGRLLIALILHTQGILQQPLLYLSLFLKQHRAEYYQLLDQCRFQGDWERWLAFFLEGVKVTAEGAVETANRLMESFADDAARIRSLGRASGNALQIFEQLKQRPVMGITDIADRAGVAFQTASRAVSNLEELGVVEEITGRKRDRIYAYGQYLAILSEGAEPL